jgi:uncharacterized protein (TIGR03437 family)
MKKYLPSGFAVTHPLLARPILAGIFLLASSIASAQGISIVSGNGQVICSQCPTRSFMFDPLVVMVKDARGAPVPNATVTWTVNNPPGSDGRVTSASTVTGADGTSSNNFFLSSPITLLTPFLQASVIASAAGSSVTFSETDGAVTSGTGIAQISSNLQSPIPGTLLSGSPGSISSIPIKIAMSSFFPSGPVPGVEIKVVPDPAFPATAACSTTVLTDSKGVGTCNLQFGNTVGQGKIKVYVGGNYDIFGPIVISVSGTGGNPGGPPVTNPPPPSGPTLTVLPSALSFFYPGAVTQNVSVSSPSGSTNYTAAIQVGIAQVTWLTVGTPSGPASANGASSFAVTINPQGLQQGIYGASIAVHANNGAPDVVIPVQLNVQGSGPPPTTPPGNPFAPPGPLSANPTSLNFQSPGQAGQFVTISSSGSAVSYTASVQVSIAAVTWLALGPPSGPASSGAPSTFQVNVNPQGLQAGTYRTSILVHPDNGTADLTIPVQLVVQGVTTPPTTPPPVNTSAIYATPGTMRVSSIAGASSINAGSFGVTATGPSVQFSASANGGSWLSVSPNSGVTPASVSISVNASALQAGSYQGTIVISSAGATNGPQTVTVNLTVQPSQNLTLSANSLMFASQVDAQPAPQTVVASASSGVLTFNAVAAAVSPLGANWLGVTPSTGAAGNPAANLTVSVNPAGLQPGTYTGMVTLSSPGAGNSPQAVSVIYVVSPRPIPAPTIITNAASGIPGAISPGEILSISGSNMGPITAVKDPLTDTVQKSLGDTQVTFDNIPAPLLSVSDSLISAIVPYGIAGRATTRMAVFYKGTPSLEINLNVADAAPGIMVGDAGQAVITNEDGGTNGSGAPAPKGSVIVFYATGEGVTAPFGADGKIFTDDPAQLAKPVQQVSVSIGGVPAVVQYAGSAPGMVAGYMQVNAVIPDDAPSGDGIPIVLTVGSSDSPAATMSVQ